MPEDKMPDIFGQRHGRKNFFFQHVLNYIETVDRIKYANFQLSYFSDDSRFISWENGESLRFNTSWFQPPAIWVLHNFFGQKSYRPQVRRCPYAYA